MIDKFDAVKTPSRNQTLKDVCASPRDKLNTGLGKTSWEEKRPVKPAF
jgi:hypothetical protein